MMIEKIQLPVTTPIISQPAIQEAKPEQVEEPLVINSQTEPDIDETQIILADKVKELEAELAEKSKELDTLKQLQQQESDFETLSFLFQELEGSVKAGLEQFSLQASDVVIAALTKILGKSLIKPEVALNAIKSVIDSSNASEIHKIKVSPEDYLLVEKYRSQLEFNDDFSFMSDVKVQSGGCILELSSGLIDGRIDVQLKTLHEVLRNARG